MAILSDAVVMRKLSSFKTLIWVLIASANTERLLTEIEKFSVLNSFFSNISKLLVTAYLSSISRAIATYVIERLI